MWRMTLVAVFAAAVYFAVPLAAPAPPEPPVPSESDTFGKPWTIDGLVTALRDSGLTVELGTIENAHDLEREWSDVALAASGTFGGHGGVILVYSTHAARRSIWEGHPDDDRVQARIGPFGIPEITAMGLDNAVIVFDMHVEPGTPKSQDLFGVVGALRQD